MCVACLATSMATVVLAVAGLGVLIAVLARGPVDLPRAQTLVAEQMNKRLTGRSLAIGGVALMSGGGGIANRLQLRDVTLRDDSGAPILTLPDVRTAFTVTDLVHGTFAPTEITIVGTAVTLRRDRDGSIDLLSGGFADGEDTPDVMAFLNDLVARPELAALTRVDLSGATVSLIDAATDRSWLLDDSTLTLIREDGRFKLRAAVSLGDDGSDAATSAVLRMTADFVPGASETGVSFQFEQADPARIADLFLAFDWLRNIESRMSGSMRATLLSDGRLSDLSGVLDLGQGRLSGTPDNRPVTFERAKVYFTYDQATETLNLSEIDAATSSGAFKGAGYAVLERAGNGSVTALAGQLRLRDILIYRPELFDAPVVFAEAALDARVSFDPLTVTVGRLSIFDDVGTYRATGHSIAGETDWTHSYDIAVDHIDDKRIKQLWPKTAVWKTRLWVNENVRRGVITEFRGGVRSTGSDLAFAFNFGIENALARVVKTAPLLQDGHGFGYLTQNDMRLTLTSGHVLSNGEPVRMDGSSLYIPDIWARPTPGEITLHAEGGVKAALHLLDIEKFKFLTKAGVKPDIADGRAVVTGQFNLPLEKKAKIKDVTFSVQAQLSDVRSDTLIKNRQLRADRLDVAVTHDGGIRMTGDVTLDGVPAAAEWTQPFGEAAKNGSTVVAQVTLSDPYMRRLGINLPRGSVSGAAPGQMTIKLRKGQAPAFHLTSRLQGARLAIPDIGWAKSAGQGGSLDLSGTLGDTPTVDSLALSAAGLIARGRLVLRAGGGLVRAVLDDIKIGGWLDSQATIVPRGNGGSDITLAGGALDLRSFNPGAGGGGGSGGNTRIKASFARVTITSELFLSGFSTDLTTGGGLRGPFAGRVNGGTAIDGEMFPQASGTAFEIRSGNAGGVLASSGLLENVRGGNLRVVLVPRDGKGNYDGTMEIKRTRLTRASAMADLLNAISLVGLLQQLDGEGIHFSTVDGQFRMRDGAVELKNISAVGPSMGITLAGYYNAETKSVDFEGVTTPLYAVNGLFERLFGPLMGRRKGEGMFSFTYRMRGPAANPKVGVNPLSILTPGAFREIFRQNAPTPPAGFSAASEPVDIRRSTAQSGEQAPVSDDPNEVVEDKVLEANPHRAQQRERDALR